MVSFGVQIPVEDRQWLEGIAQVNGVEVAQLVRYGVTALRQYVEAHNGELHLPLNINAHWTAHIEAAPVTKLPPSQPGGIDEPFIAAAKTAKKAS